MKKNKQVNSYRFLRRMIAMSWNEIEGMQLDASRLRPTLSANIGLGYKNGKKDTFNYIS